MIRGVLLAAIAASGMGCGGDDPGARGATRGATFEIDYAEACLAAETCLLDRPIVVGGGLDLFVTLAEPARDPAFDLEARSTDASVLVVEGSAPQGDPEATGERIYIVSVRGVGAGSATLELAATGGEVIARTPVEIAPAATLIVHVGEEAPIGTGGTPEIGIGDAVLLWAEARTAADGPMFAGDAPAWSIPGLETAAFLTDAGDAMDATGETALLAGNAAGMVVVGVTAPDATAMQAVRVVDPAAMP